MEAMAAILVVAILAVGFLHLYYGLYLIDKTLSQIRDALKKQ
jgi:hypothetical protein